MESRSAARARLDLLTQELNDAMVPDAEGTAPLAPEVYAELRRLAARCLRRERRAHTLEATALVHEAFLHLSGGTQHFDSRAHFFRLAARTMRNLLINHARRRNARKRTEGRQRLGLTDVTLMMEGPSVDVLSLNQVLEILEQKDARKARIVELRFFAGCTVEETAEALGISVATVEREWRFTRAWLVERLESPPSP